MIFATNNKDKLNELKDIFKEYKIYSLKDKNINIEVEENEENFYDNAYKKAKEIYNISKETVIADDSGLCITALDDFPGVMTHRFLGDNASDEDRNNDLINRLHNISDRSAKVVCNLVYYDGTTTLVGEGILKGKIVESPRGENGFGFDPIFELPNGKTLAELTTDEKNKISARYLAAKDLQEKINKNIKDKLKHLVFRKITKEEFDKLKSLSPGNEESWIKYRNMRLNQFDNSELDIFVIEYNKEFIGELTVHYVNHDLQSETIPNIRVYLEAFRLKKEYQGRGLGQALIKHTIDSLAKQGYTEFTIGVEDDNEVAKHIYFKYGFTDAIDKGHGNEFDPCEYTLYLKDLKRKDC